MRCLTILFIAFAFPALPTRADWRQSPVLGPVYELEPNLGEPGNWLYHTANCAGPGEGEWVYAIPGLGLGTSYLWDSQRGWLYVDESSPTWAYSFDLAFWLEGLYATFSIPSAGYIGLSLEDAIALANVQGRPGARSVWIDGEPQAVTADYSPCRLNFSLQDGIVIDAATDREGF